MRIAIPYENGEIFQHFGHTEQFKLYDLDGTHRLVCAKIISTGGQGHGALTGLLTGLDVQILICGGIGPGAQQALANAGITLYAGISGSADEAVCAFAEGKLVQNECATCSHHDHADGGESCSEHGCVTSSCHNR